MGSRKYVIEVPEIIQKVVDLNRITWNEACNHVNFCRYESGSEDWDIESINEFIEDNPNRLEFIALKAIMEKDGVSKATIVND